MTNVETFKALLSVAESMAKLHGMDFEEFKWAREAIARMEPASPALIEAAREAYGSDEVQIDPDALTSETDDGVWVSAWVYVANEGD